MTMVLAPVRRPKKQEPEAKDNNEGALPDAAVTPETEE
jgi:hypothetical protein